MEKSFSGRRISRSRNLRQAYVLLGLGIIILLAAWLLHPSTATYPIGVLVLGIGCCIAVVFNPYRLAVMSWFSLLVGLYVFIAFKNIIHFNGGESFSALIIALGLALLGTAFMARRGYVGHGAISPAILTLGVGLVEYLLAANVLHGNVVTFILSLWFPAIVLLLFGLFYLLTSSRV